MTRGDGSVATAGWRVLAQAVRWSPRLALLLAARQARRGDRRGARDLLLRVRQRRARRAVPPALDRALARLHQELGEPLAALASARAVLAREPSDLVAAEIAIRSAHRLEREAEVTALIEGATRAAGLAQPGDGAALARLLLAAERAEEALATAAAASASHARTSIQFDAAYAAGHFSTAAEAGERLAAAAPLKPRQRRMADEVARARAIVPDEGARFPQALFEAAFAQPSNRDRAATDTIVLATSTLANAGAERQVALTARLVADARAATSGARTLLLARSLDAVRGHAARLTLAQSPALEIEDLSRTPAALPARLAAGGVPPETLALIAAFPQRLREDILQLFVRFHALRPRVVHLWQDGTIAVGAVAAVLAGVPRIVAGLRNVPPDVRDRRRATPWLLPMYRALAARDDVRFVANSQAGADDYAAAIGLSPEAIGVIHNGIDGDEVRHAAAATSRMAIRAELDVPEGASLVGGAFRLARHKRPELWLRTAARVAEQLPDTRFVILGGGVMRPEMEALAHELGLGARLIFAGARDPVEPWLAALDLYLLCSAQEGLPNALIEAQALAVPAVITPAGGAPEAIADGRTGVLVPEATPTALSAAIIALLADSSRRQAMAVAAPALVEERFGFDRMLAETLALYED